MQGRLKMPADIAKFQTDAKIRLRIGHDGAGLEKFGRSKNLDKDFFAFWQRLRHFQKTSVCTDLGDARIQA